MRYKVSMPIYEYRCESCGDKFEKLVRRATDVMEDGCPACGEKHLRQEYSTFAAHQGSSSQSSFTPAETRGCPSGMCSTPDLCGRN
jgi:putative FmdB family regulatory protein